MGHVVFCRDPETVSLSLLVPKNVWPEVVAVISRLGLVYQSEKQVVCGSQGEYVKIRDIEGRGDLTSELLAVLHDTFSLGYSPNEGEAPAGKIYIMLTTKKGRKRHVRKSRKKADPGSEG